MTKPLLLINASWADTGDGKQVARVATPQGLVTAELDHHGRTLRLSIGEGVAAVSMRYDDVRYTTAYAEILAHRFAASSAARPHYA